MLPPMLSMQQNSYDNGNTTVYLQLFQGQGAVLLAQKTPYVNVRIQSYNLNDVYLGDLHALTLKCLTYTLDVRSHC